MKTNPNGFMDTLMPTVINNYNKQVSAKIVMDISKYIDMNQEILANNGLYKQLLINETEQSKLYINMRITPRFVRECLKQSQYINSEWYVVSNPFNLLLTALAHKALVDNNLELANTYTLYMAFKLYASKFSRQFPKGVLPNIMTYTVNNLSYKYLLKTEGTLIGALKVTVKSAIENYKARLLEGTDKSVADFINGVDNRISDFVKNIADEYYTAHKSGKYLNYEEDKISDDKYHMADNNQFMITRVTDKVTQKITSNGIDMRLIKIAAAVGGISEPALMSAIGNILEVKLLDIRDLIEKMVSIYVINTPGCVEKEISTKKFFAETMKLYKKNNTNDPNILKVKEIIHDWLLECSEQYKKTNREATLNNFKRTIYVYFIFCVQVYSA